MPVSMTEREKYIQKSKRNKDRTVSMRGENQKMVRHYIAKIRAIDRKIDPKKQEEALRVMEKCGFISHLDAHNEYIYIVRRNKEEEDGV